MGDRVPPTAPPATTTSNSPGDGILDGIDGEIGPIEQVLHAPRSASEGGDDPQEWAVVNTGLLSNQPHLVPLHQAQHQGNRVLVPYDRATIETSPSPQDADAAPTGKYRGALTAHYTNDEHRLAPTSQEILQQVDTTGPQDTDASATP